MIRVRWIYTWLYTKSSLSVIKSTQLQCICLPYFYLLFSTRPPATEVFTVLTQGIIFISPGTTFSVPIRFRPLQLTEVIENTDLVVHSLLRQTKRKYNHKTVSLTMWKLKITTVKKRMFFLNLILNNSVTLAYFISLSHLCVCKCFGWFVVWRQHWLSM